MKFTIVTPSYNKGAYIERTIQSVLAQQHPTIELEYLVLDNFSDDGTTEILDRYAQHPLVQVHRYHDRGQADAINQGWQKGSGEIYAWLNADDVYLEQVLPQVAEYFQQHPQVMAIYGEAVYVDANDRVLKPVTNIRNYSRKQLLSHDFITQPATFLRREVVERTGLLATNYRYVFDWDYWIRVSRRYEFVRVPIVVAGYRITGENLTTTGNRSRFQEMLQVVWRQGGLFHLLRFGMRLVRKYAARKVEIPSVNPNQVTRSPQP
ncbi:glycosyltransferase family 2 protein [Alkalinema pantanalense CENA528]|uniref:glycosyltransferase family 2 protein n=1 Tax=Alkalinema pantanalense TaxID=1620705 RepID=UPI003D6E9D5B